MTTSDQACSIPEAMETKPTCECHGEPMYPRADRPGRFRCRARMRDRGREWMSVGNRGWVLKRKRELAARRERITNQLEALHGTE